MVAMWNIALMGGGGPTTETVDPIKYAKDIKDLQKRIADTPQKETIGDLIYAPIRRKSHLQNRRIN